MHSFDSALGEMQVETRKLRAASLEVRNQVLRELSKKLDSERAAILKANAEDFLGLSGNVNAAFRDRLLIDDKRIDSMRESLKQVEAYPDPLGEVVDSNRLENGLKVRRVRGALGVILMIFESRPNVAIEAFSLAFKSGNGLILRGGKESRATVTVLYRLIRESIESAGLPGAVFIGITDPDREIVRELLTENQRIDVVVPRGGRELIHFVMDHATMPIIKNDRGLCHTYVHSDADLVQATRIIENAKVQRPGVCNSMETLLIHELALESLVKVMSKNAGLKTVAYRTCEKSTAVFNQYFPGSVHEAQPLDYHTEYLDLILSVKVVSSVEEAITHIDSHGSKHSEAILTQTESVARVFQTEVDAAAVYWNTSTRFTDGFSLGLGGELGISTQKLHVRGPVGLRELTSVRWVIDGEGQIR